MQTLRTLIDKASEMCGGDKELALKLGVYRPDVSAWRSGRRPLSPETAAILADLAHMDPMQAMADAVIERNKGTRLGDTLREVLGKALAAGVAGALVFSYSGDSISAMDQMTKGDAAFTKLYIVLSQIRRQLTAAGLRWVRIARRLTWGLAPYPTLRPSGRSYSSLDGARRFSVRVSGDLGHPPRAHPCMRRGAAGCAPVSPQAGPLCRFTRLSVGR